MLEILFQDESLVAINKPNGLLVHRTSIAREVTTFAVQELRNQLGRHVFPIHRLDRKTSGVLWFALNEETLIEMQKRFAERKILKSYLAVVRGYTPEKAIIDYGLANERGNVQKAVTEFETLQISELDVPFGKFSTSRYSLVRAYPQTGRMHQLRKHFAHIRHPIIGDRPHGCNKQNRLFKERWGLTNMLLHARSTTFSHPISEAEITISAGLPNEFLRIGDILKFDLALTDHSTKRL